MSGRDGGKKKPLKAAKKEGKVRNNLDMRDKPLQNNKNKSNLLNKCLCT